MKNFEDIINMIDRKGLEASIDTLKSVLNTPDGKKIKDQLKTLDKKALMHKLNNMNMQNIPNGQKIKEYAKDPDIINKLNQFLNNNK